MPREKRLSSALVKALLLILFVFHDLARGREERSQKGAHGDRSPDQVQTARERE